MAEEIIERYSDQIIHERGVDVEKLVRILDIKVAVADISDVTIRGVSLAGPLSRPGILINSGHKANSYPSGRRFTLAHELCHIFFDREQGRKIAIASGPWAPRDVERRANAFAAMLLMPRDLVKKAIAQLAVKLESKEGVVQVAHRLGSSFTGTLSHLTNLGFLDEYMQQRISEEAVEASIQYGVSE